MGTAPDAPDKYEVWVQEVLVDLKTAQVIIQI